MTYTREEIEEKCKSAFEEAAAGMDFPEIKPDSKIALDLEIDSIHILETMIQSTATTIYTTIGI